MQCGPGGQLISWQVYIADLRDPQSLEGAGQAGNRDVMTADQHAVRFEAEGIGPDGGPCRSQPRNEASPSDSHQENLVGSEEIG
jgi:hypothetical protein